MIWITFFISSLIIIISGVKLTKYADQLSDQYNLGKAWIGALLLGWITSIPEAITCIWAVLKLDAADLAVGNILGSNSINPLILVVMDLLYTKGVISDKVFNKESHKYAAFMSVFISLIVCFEIFLSGRLSQPIPGQITIGTWAICGLYFFGMREVFKREKCDTISKLEITHVDVNKDFLLPVKLGITAVCVVIGAIFLADSCDQIAIQTGLGRTFIGSLLLAFVTSLPEIVVSVSALRLGSFDMAVGNIVGSNLSNLFILAICSIVSKATPMMFFVNTAHIITLISSIILVMLAMVIISKPWRKWGCLSLVSYTMILVYLTSSFLLYKLN